MNPGAQPEAHVRLARFLRRELAPFPWRINVSLRCVLASAIVIVTSMALDVPALALSLLCVFYVSQSNVVVTRLAGMLFLIGVTLGVVLALILFVATFDHPLLRILMASLLFFASVYLMRILKVGVMFFLVAIIVIYVQSFVDQIGVPDPLVRLILWVWVATAYPILTTLLINTWLLPLEPIEQFKDEIRRRLSQVGAVLSGAEQGVDERRDIHPDGYLTVMLAMQKLLKFAVMRDPQFRADEAYQLALVASVARLYRAAGALPASLPAQNTVLRELRTECSALEEAVRTGVRYKYHGGPLQTEESPGLADIRRTLQALSDFTAQPQLPKHDKPSEPMLAPDAFSNPVYARFALKTLLAVLIGYVFYNSIQWQGIHTVMLTCVIVASPSLGASVQKAALRVGGALVGSALALIAVVFIIPGLDSIAGLLILTLPVIALAAWVAAGSEHISYAGIQLMFTFSLALLERFGPTADLTEIRDRIVGVLLGVGLSIALQALIWPEGEADALRRKLAGLFRSLGAMLRGDAEGNHMAYVVRHMRTWSELAATEAMMSRVSMEPDWGEGENELTTFRTQSVLANVRELLVAAENLHDQLAPPDIRPEEDAAARAVQTKVADELGRYADGLVADPVAAHTPSTVRFDPPPWTAAPLMTATQDLLRQLESLPDWHAKSTQAEAPGMRAQR